MFEKVSSFFFIGCFFASKRKKTKANICNLKRFEETFCSLFNIDDSFLNFKMVKAFVKLKTTTNGSSFMSYRFDFCHISYIWSHISIVSDIIFVRDSVQDGWSSETTKNEIKIYNWIFQFKNLNMKMNYRKIML